MKMTFDVDKTHAEKLEILTKLVEECRVLDAQIQELVSKRNIVSLEAERVAAIVRELEPYLTNNKEEVVL
jgi:hypothetical protein